MRGATTKQIAAATASSGPNAAAEACEDAVRELNGDPGLLIAFVSGDRDFDRDASAMAEAATDAPYAGMTGKGLIGPSGALDDGCVAIAFGTEVSAAVAASEGVSDDLRGAGSECT